jgi:solute carrier family 25 (mitochondrial phosphate transporter), member 23/24/25/41
VTGMKAGVLGTKYTGAIDALQSIVRNEGLQGLYRGLWPNLRMSLFICPGSDSRIDV